MYEALRTLDLRFVLSALGFADFKERKNGTEWFGTCPVHKGNNKSCFSFDQTGRFNCFSCSTKGKGAIDLVKAVKDCNFQDAITYLQTLNLSGQGAVRQTHPIQEETPGENKPYKASYEKYFVSSNWLKERGFSQDTLNYFGVGEYNNPQRKSAYSGHIMFPIKRFSDGEVVGYLSRPTTPIQGQPKYLWPKGVAKSLEVFGSYELRNELQRRVEGRAYLRQLFLVESPLCVMSFHQKGFPAVSCYGWPVSAQQRQLLQQLARGVIYLPDANKHSEALAQVGLLSECLWVKTPHYSTQDPEHLSVEELQALLR